MQHYKADWLLNQAEQFFPQQRFEQALPSPQFVLVDLTSSFSHLSLGDICKKAGSVEQLFWCPLQFVTLIEYFNNVFQLKCCFLGITHLFSKCLLISFLRCCIKNNQTSEWIPNFELPPSPPQLALSVLYPHFLYPFPTLLRSSDTIPPHSPTPQCPNAVTSHPKRRR